MQPEASISAIRYPRNRCWPPHAEPNRGAYFPRKKFPTWCQIPADTESLRNRAGDCARVLAAAPAQESDETLENAGSGGTCGFRIPGDSSKRRLASRASLWTE